MAVLVIALSLFYGLVFASTVFLSVYVFTVPDNISTGIYELQNITITEVSYLNSSLAAGQPKFSLSVRLPDNVKTLNDVEISNVKVSISSIAAAPATTTTNIASLTVDPNTVFKIKAGKTNTIPFTLSFDGSMQSILDKLLYPDVFCSTKHPSIYAMISACISHKPGSLPPLCINQMKQNLTSILCPTASNNAMNDSSTSTTTSTNSTITVDKVLDSLRFFGIDANPNVFIVSALDLNSILPFNITINADMLDFDIYVAPKSNDDTTATNQRPQNPLISLRLSTPDNIYTDHSSYSTKMLNANLTIDTSSAANFFFLSSTQPLNAWLNIPSLWKTEKFISFNLSNIFTPPLLAPLVINPPSASTNSSSSSGGSSLSDLCKTGIEKFLPTPSINEVSFSGTHFAIELGLSSSDFTCPLPPLALGFFIDPTYTIKVSSTKSAANTFATLQISSTQIYDSTSKWPRKEAHNYVFTGTLDITNPTVMNQQVLQNMFLNDGVPGNVYILLSNSADTTGEVWIPLQISDETGIYALNTILPFLFVSTSYTGAALGSGNGGIKSAFVTQIDLPDFVSGLIPDLSIAPLSWAIDLVGTPFASFPGAYLTITISNNPLKFSIEFSAQYNSTLTDAQDAFAKSFEAIVSAKHLPNGKSQHTAVLTTLPNGPSFQLSIPKDPRVLYCFFESPALSVSDGTNSNGCRQGTISCINNLPFSVTIPAAFDATSCVSGVATASSSLSLGPKSKLSFSPTLTVRCNMASPPSYPGFTNTDICAYHTATFGGVNVDILLFNAEPKKAIVNAPTSSPTSKPTYSPTTKTSSAAASTTTDPLSAVNTQVAGAKAGIGVLLAIVILAGPALALYLHRRRRRDDIAGEDEKEVLKATPST